MTRNTPNYRIYTAPQARLLIIQAAGTWAEIDSIRIPEDPGILQAVKDGIDEILAAEAGTKTPAKAEAETSAPPKRGAAKKSK